MTRWAGNPLSANATQVSTSTGLVMTRRMPWNPVSLMECTIPFTMATLRSIRSTRDSPGRWRAPAVMMAMELSAQASYSVASMFTERPRDAPCLMSRTSASAFSLFESMRAISVTAPFRARL